MGRGYLAVRAGGASYFALAATVIALSAVSPDAGAESFRRIPSDVIAAERSGPVRVIVRLVQPPGTSVDRAQEAALAELAGTTYRVLHRYGTSPFLALEVAGDALRVLDRSSNVVSVTGDKEAHTQDPGAKR